MEDSYEDDAHYCLKCHSTIIGLDNYVNHRKLICNSKTSANTFPPSEESIPLKADDFFSSLELQSSSKKTSHSTPNNKTCGIFTRSKTQAALHNNNTSVKDLPSPNQPKQVENAWVEEEGVKSVESPKKMGDSKTVESDESDQEFENMMVEDDDIEGDDYEEEYSNVPPKSFTGGKWKPHSPIQWYGNQAEWNSPPPTHTGGKWRPIQYTSNENRTTNKPKSPLPSTSKETNLISSTVAQISRDKMKPESATKKEYSEVDIVEHKLIEDVPPPSYTKGKWKPPMDVKSSVPPPSHTKGKWKPKDRDDFSNAVNKKIYGRPFVKSNGRIHYWCGPCNRRLSSKIVYNRHLKSELHLKRTNDVDFDNVPRIKNKCRATETRIVSQKRNLLLMKQRKRKRIYVECSVCKSRVNLKTMGKHLISHYHCRRAYTEGIETQQLILDNIHSIVHQCPFQCAPCQFYCNTQEAFLKHWKSPMHEDKKYINSGYYSCSFCKFKSVESEEMYHHLTSEEHLEVVSVINRSVPIVIKRITPVKCPTCSEEFALNIQLKKHCNKLRHMIGYTASDSYQNIHKCNVCLETFKSMVALQRHMIIIHKRNMFICGTCSLTFETMAEVKSHRRSWQHGRKFLEKKQSRIKVDSDPKECNFCSKICSNFTELKRHQTVEHPEIKYNCPHCGLKFSISQELTVHVRTKACTFTDTEKKQHSCTMCPFKTDSLSEYLFHNILHTEALFIYPKKDVQPGKPTKRPIEQYKCSVCDKFFPKSSLLGHLRLHTSERPFSCKFCKASFVRKNNLLYHMKKHGANGEVAIGRKDKKSRSSAEATPVHLCSTCGASFRKRFILKQHMTRHTGKSFKCPMENCVFSARTSAELKNHLLVHDDDKPFKCPQCDYRGKTKRLLLRHSTLHDSNKKYHCSQCPFSTRLSSHLRRHLRLHTGAKPYACPHCDYRCNTLENLRKHVLSTFKHPGKFIYECKLCKEDVYRTNFAKDYKVHLVNEHNDEFKSNNEAASFVTGIYEAIDDTPNSKVILDAIKGHNLENKENSQNPEEITNLQEASTSGTQTATNNSGPAVLLTSVSVQEHKFQDELFPMFIVSKKAENMSESWIMEENYDVEESGVLIPFQSEGDSLFNEHF